jgi:hypothetical protein
VAFRSGRQQHTQVYPVPGNVPDKIVWREYGRRYVYFAVNVSRNGVLVLFTTDIKKYGGKRYQ